MNLTLAFTLICLGCIEEDRLKILILCIDVIGTINAD